MLLEVNKNKFWGVTNGGETPFLVYFDFFVHISKMALTISIKFFLALVLIGTYKGKYFGGNCLFIPPLRIKYLSFSLSNLNFGVSPPWLEKILNLAPLKCLEMLPNRPDMWKLSD